MTHRSTRTLCLVAACLVGMNAALAAEPPCIGIVYTAEKGRALAGKGEDGNLAYRRALTECGAAVVVLSQHEPRGALRERFDSLDGLLLPGGIDVEPKRYGEAPHPKLENVDADLDALEFEALDHAERRRLPVLGICRGHQVLNVYYGGSLYQDIPSQHNADAPMIHRVPKDSGQKPEHVISVEPDSLLYVLWKTERLVVNTYHHQAVKDIAPGFRVAARSADGIIEAIERTEGGFVLGVQFHPEKMLQNEPRMKILFERFVEEARRAAQTRPNEGAQP